MERRSLMIAISSALAFVIVTTSLKVVPLLSKATSSKVIPSAAVGIFSSFPFFIDIARFLIMFLGVYLIVALGWAYCWEPIRLRIARNKKERKQLNWLGVLLLWGWVLALNFKLYPNSSFTPYFEGSADNVLTIITYALSVVGASVLVVGGAFQMVYLGNKLNRRVGRKNRTGIIVGGVSLITVLGGVWTIAAPGDRASGVEERQQPDILMIGVDSVRTDHIDALSGSDSGLTPTLNQLLADSAVITQAWTPFARTFPAWVSILTGQYPASTGAVYNLMPREAIDDTHSLAHQLGNKGYHRIYGIDEVRFSNIDESYGFDELVAPKVGAIDFLVGIVADSPLVNVLTNTLVGRWMFPALHHNRAISHAYDPSTFDAALKDSIASVDPEKPLFLAAHYELPHWPFSWRNTDVDPFSDMPSLEEKAPAEYRAAVARVDQQVDQLMRALKANGRLDNAVVVFLSDHGEAFRESEPDWQAGKEVENQIVFHSGHGTNVFSESQYRAILGFRGYGPQKQRYSSGKAPVSVASLVDIRPTLHDWLDLPVPEQASLAGISVMPALKGAQNGAKESRAVPMESGFSLPSIEAGNPDAAEIVQQASQYYRVDFRGRLVIRDKWVDFLLRQKQRAVRSGNWILGAFPNKGDMKPASLIVANAEQRRYWSWGSTQIPADAPTKLLKEEMCQYFGGEVKALRNLCPG